MYNNIPNFQGKTNLNTFPIESNEQFYSNGQDDRFFGGFLGPFLLGGVTGGLVAPLFYNNNNNNQGYYNQPPYYTNNYYYPPYSPPYYGPYYY